MLKDKVHSSSTLLQLEFTLPPLIACTIPSSTPHASWRCEPLEVLSCFLADGTCELADVLGMVCIKVCAPSLRRSSCASDFPPRVFDLFWGQITSLVACENFKQNSDQMHPNTPIRDEHQGVYSY